MPGRKEKKIDNSKSEKEMEGSRTKTIIGNYWFNKDNNRDPSCHISDLITCQNFQALHSHLTPPPPPLPPHTHTVTLRHICSGMLGVQTQPPSPFGSEKKRFCACLLVREVDDVRGYPYPVSGKNFKEGGKKLSEGLMLHHGLYAMLKHPPWKNPATPLVTLHVNDGDTC